VVKTKCARVTVKKYCTYINKQLTTKNKL